MGDIHTFWDDEKERSELHVNGWVLYGDDRTTAAVMAELNRLIHISAELRLHILEIDKAVSAAMSKGMRP